VAAQYLMFIMNRWRKSFQGFGPKIGFRRGFRVKGWEMPLFIFRTDYRGSPTKL